MLMVMDPNNGEPASPAAPNFRQTPPAPVARQSFNVPVNRPFAAQPVQPIQAITPPTQLQPEPFSAPQPVATPQATSVGYQTPAPSAPLSFEPKTVVKQKRQFPLVRFTANAKRQALKLSRKQQALAAVLAIVVIAGTGLGAQKLFVKPAPGISAHGRKIAISEPTVSDHLLESSCYSVTLPEKYTLTHTGGCYNEINLPKAAPAAAISIVSNPSITAFSLKEAPLALQDQLKVVGKLSSYQTSKTTVNGIDAIKATYQIANGPTQVLVYVPSPPAKYTTGVQEIGAFAIRGYYDTPVQQSTFDSMLATLHWVR